MDKIIRKICEAIVNKYRKDKNILGIVLFGSAVRNKFDRYSDIDIYIILKKKINYSRLNFIKDNIRVDIIMDTIKKTELFLKEDEFNIKRNISHMLAYGKILYQASDDINRIITKAKQNLRLPTKYTKNEILMHKYSIDDFWGEVQRDIKNHDYTAFGLDSQLLLNNLIELFLKFNGGFFKQPNEISIVLNKLDRNFGRQIERFYKATNFKTKENILSWLVKYVYKKSEGGLPRRWTIKN